MQSQASSSRREGSGGAGWLRLWPVALPLLVLGLVYAFGLQRHLSVEALAEYRETLSGLVQARPVAAAALYLLAYTIAAAAAVPAGPVMTMAGGLLFGIWLGTAFALVAATAGACLLFLAVHSALRPMVERRAGRLVDRIRPGLERDGFWYLLSLRLLPIVPYWLGSIAPALVGMRLGAFAAATALGILPGTAVFASLGAGLDDALARGAGKEGLSAMLSPSVLLPLLGLAVLSLVTAWWRRRRRQE